MILLSERRHTYFGVCVKKIRDMMNCHLYAYERVVLTDLYKSLDSPLTLG